METSGSLSAVPPVVPKAEEATGSGSLSAPLADFAVPIQVQQGEQAIGRGSLSALVAEDVTGASPADVPVARPPIGR